MKKSVHSKLEQLALVGTVGGIGSMIYPLAQDIYSKLIHQSETASVLSNSQNPEKGVYYLFIGAGIVFLSEGFRSYLKRNGDNLG